MQQKSFFARFFGHLHTINKHKRTVMKHCFKIGLYKRGLLHDMSKYSPSEFFVGVKYFRGDISPNNVQREKEGVAAAWLHHKGRNKHHYEYWIDYSKSVAGGMIPVRMPDRYIAEMIMDRIAATKVYKGKNYTDDTSLQYYYSGTDSAPMHEETRKILVHYLQMLAEKGEKETFFSIKEELVQHKRNVNWED